MHFSILTQTETQTQRQTGKEGEGPGALGQPVLWTRKADVQRLRVLRKAECTLTSTTLLFNSFLSWWEISRISDSIPAAQHTLQRKAIPRCL